MKPRAFHVILFADYVIGAVFALSLFIFGAMALAVSGGPLKPYEAQALGEVYAGFLGHVEQGAHDLRTDYCERTGNGCNPSQA